MVEESDMKLDECSREAWCTFLGNEKNLGHTSRSLVGDSIDSHVDACWNSALQTVQRIQHDLPELLRDLRRSLSLALVNIYRWKMDRST
jgi:hypothetical protein